MNTVEKIYKILKKHKVKYRTLSEDKFNSTDFLEIFSELIPERLVIFDPDCISDVASYVDVLRGYIAPSLNEFSPTSIHAIGDFESVITLTFEHSGKKRRFKIQQDGSGYLSASFADCLENFCRRNLTGSFLTLPCDLNAEIYLPKKVIKAINEEIFSKQSTDAVVDNLRQGSDVWFYDWWNLPFEILNGHTKEGETIVTAIFAEKLYEKPFNFTDYNSQPASLAEFYMYCFDNSVVNVYLQNTAGKTPLQLAKDINMKGFDKEELAFLEPLETYSFDEILEKQKGTYTCFGDKIMPFFLALQSELEGMHFKKNELYSLVFSRNKNFFHGEDSVELLPAYDINSKEYIGHELFVQQSGPGGGTIYKIFGENEKVELIEILRKYCLNTLWA